MLKGLLAEARDDRDILDVLKAELNFVEKGGYGRSVRAPSLPTSVFQDSPSCFCFPVHDHSDVCMLMKFVPPQFRAESVPCHHIPLNAAGETVASLELASDQQDIEGAVKNWLREKIGELERGDMKPVV